MAVLLPHLIQQRWPGVKLRVWVPETVESYADVCKLLGLCRIKAEIQTFVGTNTSKEVQNSLQRLASLGLPSTLNGAALPAAAERSEFCAQKCKQYGRLASTIRENSEGTKLLVVTLPFPWKEYRSAAEYMAAFQTLAACNHQGAPTLFIRGNQEQVLTYYI